MTVFCIIAGALLIVGFILWLHDRMTPHKPADESAPEEAATATADGDDEECCGMHITCERDSLLAAVSTKVEYFDDEELDRFAGRGATDYTDTEIEEFRDILLTLLPDDIAPWARSLQLRGINLPDPVRDELLLIVAEARAARTNTSESQPE